MSRAFVLKRFEDLFLEDVFSMLVQGRAQLFRVISIQQRLDSFARGKDPACFFEMRNRKVEGEPLEEIVKRRTTKKDRSGGRMDGSVQTLPREKVVNWRPDSVSFGATMSLLRTTSVDHSMAEHVGISRVAVGDTVVSLLDGCLYRVTDKGSSWSFEYPDTDYEWPFIRVEALPNKLSRVTFGTPQELGTETKMEWGAYSMFRQEFLPVLTPEEGRSLCKC